MNPDYKNLVEMKRLAGITHRRESLVEEARYVDELMPGTERFVEETIAALGNDLAALRERLEQVKQVLEPEPRALGDARHALDESLTQIRAFQKVLESLNVIPKVDAALSKQHKQAR